MVLKIGSTSWRTLVNYNFENVYTKTEIDSFVATKSDTVHTHPYFHETGYITSDDLYTPLYNLVDDIDLSSGKALYLTDRTTSDIYKVTIDNGSVILTLV